MIGMYVGSEEWEIYCLYFREVTEIDDEKFTGLFYSCNKILC